MISYDQALRAIHTLPLIQLKERVALSRAVGRILAEDIRLRADQPPFDRVTMDGFAISLLPGRTTYQVVATVQAGEAYVRQLQPGTAVRIMTGAPCPKNTTVVPLELSRDRGDSVECAPGALLPGLNIAWQGEDGRSGDLVLPAAGRLSPTLIAAAAMCGVLELDVHVPPRLEILITGNEVSGAGEGGIHDTNGPYLNAFAQLLQCPSAHEHVPDDLSLLTAAMYRSRSRSDIIITTGGVSGSAADLVSVAGEAAGFEKIFHHVSIQPGKPVLLARHRDGQLLVGLPGNAVSVLVTAHVILLPIISRMMGGWSWRWRELPMAESRTLCPKRRQFLPARLLASGVEPIVWNGSGDLIAAAAADGLVELPEGQPLKAGDLVRFLPYVGDSSGGVGNLKRAGAEL